MSDKIQQAFKAWVNSVIGDEPQHAWDAGIAFRAGVAWKEAQDLAHVEAVKNVTHNRYVGGDQAACEQITRRIKGGE